MDNRQKVKDIMIDLRRGDIGWVTAQDKICDLFTIPDVSKQRELLNWMSEQELYKQTSGEIELLLLAYNFETL